MFPPCHTDERLTPRRAAFPMRMVGITAFKTDVRISALWVYFQKGIKNLGFRALGGNRTRDLFLTKEARYRYATKAHYAANYYRTRSLWFNPYQGRALPAEPLRRDAPFMLEFFPIKGYGAPGGGNGCDRPYLPREAASIVSRAPMLATTPSSVSTSTIGMTLSLATASITAEKSMVPAPTGECVSSPPLLSCRW